MNYTTAPVKMMRVFDEAVPDGWTPHRKQAGLYDRAGDRPTWTSVCLQGVAKGQRPVVSFDCTVLSPRCRGWVHTLATSLLLPAPGERRGKTLGGFSKLGTLQFLYLRSVDDFGPFFAGLDAIVNAPLDGTPDHRKLLPWAKMILAGPEHPWWSDYSIARILAARVDSTKRGVVESIRLESDAEILYGLIAQVESARPGVRLPAG